MIEYDNSGDVTHEHDRDPVPAVAQNAVRLQLAAQPNHVKQALAELNVPQLRRLMQAFTAVTSAAAQIAVVQNIEEKRAAR